MSRLAEQQSLLLDALFAWPPQAAQQRLASHLVDPRGRGLRAYQANGHAAAERALQAVYPVLEQLLGAESFATLARALWHAHPPQRGDLGLWGEALAAWLAHDAQLAELPYLSDLARLEWQLHRCASAADASADPTSLALLGSEDPAQLCLRWAPGCALVCSPWPVASLVLAHHSSPPDLAGVAQLLRMQIGEDALVWRQGLRPCTRAALPGEAAFVQAAWAGAALGPALDAAPDFDFSSWFPQALQSSLVLGAALRQDL